MLGALQAVVIERGVGKVDIAGRSEIEVIEIGTRIEAVGAVGVKSQSAFGDVGAADQVTVGIDGAVDIGRHRYAAI